MTLVPARAAAVHAAGDPCLLEAYKSAAVKVASRTAVDTHRLPLSTGRELDGWWGSCQRLWRRAATQPADLVGSPWMQTRRELVRDRQNTAKGSKRDLGELYQALSALPALGGVLNLACSPDPDVRELRDAVASLGGTVAAAPGVLTLTAAPNVGLLYPGQLGGPVGAGEVSREFTVEVRHAAWRDRKVRRLAAVEVTAVEMWAPRR